MQDRYKSCVGITNLLNLSCNGHETFDQMSVCVRDWGCDTCMLLSGHFCSFIMGCWYTPCKVMVLLRLHTHVVAWTGRVSCNALWQHALCYDYWVQGIQPTALEVKCYASLAEGHLDSHQRVTSGVNFAQHDNRETEPGLPVTIYALRGIIRIVNKPWFTRYRQGQTLAIDVSYNRPWCTRCVVPEYTIISSGSPDSR